MLQVVGVAVVFAYTYHAMSMFDFRVLRAHVCEPPFPPFARRCLNKRRGVSCCIVLVVGCVMLAVYGVVVVITLRCLHDSYNS